MRNVLIDLPASFPAGYILALEKVFPVRFTTDASVRPLHATIRVVGSPHAILSQDCPVLSFPHWQEGNEVAQGDIEFSNDSRTPGTLRGHTLHEQEALLTDTESFEHVLATCNGAPVWGILGSNHYRVLCPAPAWNDDTTWNETLHGTRALFAIAVFHFIRDVVLQYELPDTIHVDFIVDDPDLTSLSYGFFAYRKMLAFARQECIHWTIATVPLGLRWSKARAARFFEENKEHFSLCIHGNNHTLRELVVRDGYPPHYAERTAAQALQRVRTFEAKRGNVLDRVVVPPHERYSSSLAAGYARQGCRGLSTAIIQPDNQEDRAFAPEQSPDRQVWGLLPADSSSGLPILERMYNRWSQNRILINIFLGKPLIVMFHHHYFEKNLEKLRDQIRWIHTLGNVKWQSMQTTLCTMYRLRHTSPDEVEVEPFSTSCSASIDPEIQHVTIRLPLLHYYQGTPRVFANDSELTLARDDQGRFFARYTRQNTSDVTIRVEYYPEPVPAYEPLPLTPFVLYRRLAVLARDKLLFRLVHK